MSGTRLFFAISLAIGAFLLLGVVYDSSDQPSAAPTGAGVWRAYGCEGCHTLAGLGGAYAPDLTHIHSQRGPDYLREFLVNPAAYHPGERVMPAFGLTQAETDDLLAFLEWVDAQTTNWPPRPILVAGGSSLGAGSDVAGLIPADTIPADPVARGEYWFKRPPAACATCHALEPDIVIVGPSLAGVASRAPDRVQGMDAEAYLRASILSPGAFVVPGFPDAMQKNLGETLSAGQINDILTFLMTQK